MRTGAGHYNLEACRALERYIAMLAASIQTFRGSIPALITPFLPGNPAVVDRQALGRLAIRVAERGSCAVVVCGSTGEGFALDAKEHAEAVETVVQALHGRIPVIAGICAPSTEGAVCLATAAERRGADALLVSAPPYVRPTQEGLGLHVRAVAGASRLPVVLYDVPSRVGVAFSDETIARLRSDGSIQGLKDATADLARTTRLRRLCGEDFLQFSGDDATALAYRAAGGVGCISVTANIVPALCAKLHAAWDARDVAKAINMGERLAPLHAMLFLETNPIPVKAVLGLLGLCDPTPRLPLTRAARETMRRLTDIVPQLIAEDDICTAERYRAA